MKQVKNKLRVCHFPQIPCSPFWVNVDNEKEAYLVSETLSNQHLFLYDNNMIDDYSNAVTIEMWAEDCDGEGNEGWMDYWNEEEMMEFEEFCETYLKNTY